MTSTHDTTTVRRSPLVRVLWAGLALQLVCTALPLVDMWVLGTTRDHVRSAYPSWSTSEVNGDVTGILSYLAGIGVLGLVTWLIALWSARTGKGVRTTVTTLFAVGMSVLLFTATAQGEAYERIVPAWLSLTTLGLVGIPAVTSLFLAWTRHPEAHRSVAVSR